MNPYEYAWPYPVNAEGPIVVECPYTVASGSYIAKARFNGDRGVLAEASGVSRQAAINAAMTALAASKYGDLVSKLPILVVNEQTGYRTV